MAKGSSLYPDHQSIGSRAWQQPLDFMAMTAHHAAHDYGDTVCMAAIFHPAR
jgi:hypothetical protein